MKQRPKYYLKEWRKHRGMTLDELASQAGYAQRGGLHKIENEKKNLTWARLQMLADALKVSPGDLFFPPPSDTKQQLQSDLKRLNDGDIEAVAALVRSLLERERRRA